MKAKPTGRASRNPRARNSPSGIIGMPDAGLHDHEPDQAITATVSAATTEGVPKPRVTAVDQPVDQRGQADDGEDLTGPVERRRTGRRGRHETEEDEHGRRRPGRLMLNTQRQSYVVSSPPSGWPMSPATAPPTAHTPRALARRAGSGKASRTRAIDAGSMIAAPAPWAQRAAISSAELGAKAQAADVTAEHGDAEQPARAWRRSGRTGCRRTAAERRTSGCSRR